MNAIRTSSAGNCSAALLGSTLAVLVLAGVSVPAAAQGAGDRAAHRALREHQQMRQQLKAEKERRLMSAQSPSPASHLTAPQYFAPSGQSAIPRQLNSQERVQLREQLRQASRQRQPVAEQIAP